MFCRVVLSVQFIKKFEKNPSSVHLSFIYILSGLKKNLRGDHLSSCHKFQRDHSETVLSKILKRIFWYKHKLGYCVYLSHTKEQIFEVIIMSKDAYSPILSGRNENYVDASSIRSII